MPAEPIEWRRDDDGDFVAGGPGWTSTVAAIRGTGLWSWCLIVDGPIPGASRIAQQGYARSEMIAKHAAEHVIGGKSRGN